MSTASSGGSLGGLFAPDRGRIALVFAVIVLRSALSVVGALLVKVVFDKAPFPASLPRSRGRRERGSAGCRG